MDRRRIVTSARSSAECRTLLEAQETVVDQHREHLLDEQRVALGRIEDAIARDHRDIGLPEEIVDELGRVVAREGSSRIEVAFILPPPQPGRTSSSSGRAMHRSRTAASRVQSARCSIRSRNVGSAQWIVVEDHHDRSLVRQVLEELPDGPERVLRRAGLSPPEEPGDQ